MNDKIEAPEDLVERWASAELNGDTDSLAELLADDFVSVGPLGFMLNREQWLGRFAGGLSYESFAIEELEVRPYGDAAVATCRQKQAGDFQGNDIAGEFRATLVFAKNESG